MNPYTLHRSLLDTTTTTTTVVNNLTSLQQKLHPNTLRHVPDIIIRLLLISLFATVAIWANHEASKGFAIAIVNDAGKYSSPGKRFSLFYESNDKATRIVLNASRFVENLLYPNDQDQLEHPKKEIESLILRLAPANFQEIVSVYSRKPNEYTIMLSPSLMESSHNNDPFVLAVLQGMARVWLWDGKGAAPTALLNGMVKYITTIAGFFADTETWNSGVMRQSSNEICWKEEDPRKVAGFLKFLDQRQQLGGGGGDGEVVRRLNKGMRNGWHDWMMDDALGLAERQRKNENSERVRERDGKESMTVSMKVMRGDSGRRLAGVAGDLESDRQLGFQGYLLTRLSEPMKSLVGFITVRDKERMRELIGGSDDRPTLAQPPQKQHRLKT